MAKKRSVDMSITTIITFIKEVVATFMILLNMVSPFSVSNGVPYEAENPDELIASIVTISDVHVETNYPESYNNLYMILDGIKAGKNIDAVVYTGDNVMNGQALENFFFYSAVKAMKPAENNFVLAGNHDLGNQAGDYEALLENYIRNNKTYLGEDVGKGYYYRVVNGCYLIMLISEEESTWDFVIGDEQLEWLENVLKEANEKNAPVLVFNHYPLYYNETTGKKVASLLNEYNANLFLYGHYHNEMGADNFSKWENINIINLPRVTETTEYGAGDGVVIEVYEGKIVVRARNFITGEWLEDLVYTYEY